MSYLRAYFALILIIPNLSCTWPAPFYMNNNSNISCLVLQVPNPSMGTHNIFSLCSFLRYGMTFTYLHAAAWVLMPLSKNDVEIAWSPI